jgi:hypothetical protein
VQIITPSLSLEMAAAGEIVLLLGDDTAYLLFRTTVRLGTERLGLSNL